MCWLLVILSALLCSHQVAPIPVNSHDVDDDVEEVKIIDTQMKEAIRELQLAERLEEMDNSTRESRGLLKKVAFLAGMRMGAGGLGLVQGSGTLAASNSLRVFGKVLNSALSVSYGTLEDLNPLPKIDGQLRPAVLSAPPVDEASSSGVKELTTYETPVAPTPDIEDIVNEQQREIQTNFLSKHNELVDRANAKYLRILRSDEEDVEHQN